MRDPAPKTTAAASAASIQPPPGNGGSTIAIATSGNVSIHATINRRGRATTAGAGASAVASTCTRAAYPARATASFTASAGPSNSTRAVFVARFTETARTPATPRIALSTRPTHDAQVIPSTSNVTRRAAASRLGLGPTEEVSAMAEK